jgi:hypothetical protein
MMTPERPVTCSISDHVEALGGTVDVVARVGDRAVNVA